MKFVVLVVLLSFLLTGCLEEQSKASTSSAIVEFTGTSFNPAVLEVSQGDAVKFENKASESFWLSIKPPPNTRFLLGV